MPVEVTTDRAATYPVVLEDLLPAAWHRTEQHANNRVEADHGRLKARLRPMRGLKHDRSARVIIAGHILEQKTHAFVSIIDRLADPAASEDPNIRQLLKELELDLLPKARAKNRPSDGNEPSG
jgi:hypothetical protein